MSLRLFEHLRNDQNGKYLQNQNENEPIDCDFDIVELDHLKNGYFGKLDKQLIDLQAANQTWMACLPWLDPDRLEYFLSSSGDILNVSIQNKYVKAIICSHEKRADFWRRMANIEQKVSRK